MERGKMKAVGGRKERGGGGRLWDGEGLGWDRGAVGKRYKGRG